MSTERGGGQETKVKRVLKAWNYQKKNVYFWDNAVEKHLRVGTWVVGRELLNTWFLLAKLKLVTLSLLLFPCLLLQASTGAAVFGEIRSGMIRRWRGTPRSPPRSKSEAGVRSTPLRLALSLYDVSSAWLLSTSLFVCFYILLFLAVCLNKRLRIQQYW